MKPILHLSIGLFLLFCACEENPDIPEEPARLDLAGEYIGAAKLICKEYRFFSNPNRTDTLVYRSETFQDKFVVEDSNPLDSLVKIHRLSYDTQVNGAFCISNYDIGSPHGEYDLRNGLSWGYKYRYDKEWDSWIIFNSDNTLSGYMLEKDVFGSTGIDRSGESYDFLKFFEYEITATRQ